ncbi:MAG: RNA ligase (ATP) [Chamaesiphon sp.]|nr:RNA ligase (ATP) [Chamaesiphon sp.]
MSTIKVEVCEILEIKPHHNADALELATVQGWQMCVKKGVHQPGDLIIYFEQGTVLSKKVSERLNVGAYLVEKTDINGDRVLVVHRIKLRGEPSFGLVVQPETGMELGVDVAAFYGAIKYHPPVKAQAGDGASDDPDFPKYTNLENMRSYPTMLATGEAVVATEKIHGTNARVGFIWHDDREQPTMMAGSRALRRKEPEETIEMVTNTYWFPHTLIGVKKLLEDLQIQGYKQAILYGEVYGHGIQAYTYNQKRMNFRAFDLMLDGKYVDHSIFKSWCDKHQVEQVPLIYEGAFSLEVIKQISDGDSLIGGNHGREGVVVKPIVERDNPKSGRVILKYIGDRYLFGKVAEQDTTDV